MTFNIRYKSDILLSNMVMCAIQWIYFSATACEVTFIYSFFSTGRREFVQRLKLEAILKVHDGCVSIKSICRFMFCLMFPSQSSHNFSPRYKFQQVYVSLFDVIYHEDDGHQSLTLTCCDSVLQNDFAVDLY